MELGRLMDVKLQILDFRLKIFQFAICNLKFEMVTDGRER